jgi:hypothetical protein
MIGTPVGRATITDLLRLRRRQIFPDLRQKLIGLDAAGRLIASLSVSSRSAKSSSPQVTLK